MKNCIYFTKPNGSNSVGFYETPIRLFDETETTYVIEVLVDESKNYLSVQKSNLERMKLFVDPTEYNCDSILAYEINDQEMHSLMNQVDIIAREAFGRS